MRRSGTSLVVVILSLYLSSTTASAAPTESAISKADRAMQAGRFADAVREYEAWLTANPASDSKAVLFALGVCYLQLGRQAEAVSTLGRFVKLAPDSAAGHASLGIALLDGSISRAKRELETALRLNPRQADAAEALARLYLVEGKTDLAISLLEPLARSGSDMQLLLADALVRAGRASEAASLLTPRLATGPPGDPRTHVAAAWAFLKSGDLTKAAEVCEEGMRLYPDSEIEGIYLSLPSSVLAQRMGARIKHLQETPELAELIAVGRVLIDVDPNRKTRANEIATSLLKSAIELGPENASAHYNYGRALSRNSLERGIEQWEKALTLRPDDDLRVQILTKIAAARLELADYPGTEDAYKAALEANRRLSHRNSGAALEYVRFLHLKARTTEAEDVLNEVLAWAPLSPEARAERGRLMTAKGQWDNVVAEGEFVLRAADGDKALVQLAHVLLARAYTQLNQPEKARLHRSRIETK